MADDGIGFGMVAVELVVEARIDAAQVLPWLLLFVPSGHVVADQVTCVTLVPVSVAPVRLPCEVIALGLAAEPLTTACVLGCAVQTGVGAVLNTANVEEGATVVVLGAGGVGISVVQGAVLAGASTIVVSDPVAERRDAAKRFGATHVIDPTTEDLHTACYDLTGIGMDYAFEAAGFRAVEVPFAAPPGARSDGAASRACCPASRCSSGGSCSSG